MTDDDRADHVDRVGRKMKDLNYDVGEGKTKWVSTFCTLSSLGSLTLIRPFYDLLFERSLR